MPDSLLTSGVALRLQVVVDEAESLFRRGAFSACLADDGETAAVVVGPLQQGDTAEPAVWREGRDSNPFQAALLVEWLKALPLSLEPDTVVLSNDPFAGGSSLCDLRMALPVYDEGELLAVVASAGHYADLGGRLVGGVSPAATEVQQEGFRVGPVAIARGDGQLEKTAGLLASNCRSPQDFLGDLQAQVDGLRAGARRLVDLAGKNGPDVLRRWVAEAGKRQVNRVKAALSEFEPGVYVSRDRLDGCMDRALRLRTTVTVRGEGLSISFEGSSGPVCTPYNCPASATRAACIAALRHVLPDLPCHDALSKLVEIDIPSGGLLDAVFPLPVGAATHETAVRVMAGVMESVSGAVHGRGQAVGGGGANVLVLEGQDCGKPYALRLTLGAGAGASGRGDGLANADSAGRYSTFPSLESLERGYPVRIHQHSRRPGTGGPGRYRGGEGTVFELEITDGPVNVTLLLDRGARGASGLHRGGRGSTTKAALHTDGHWVSLSAGQITERVPLQAGDRVRIETAGGGGYGHPYERAIRLVSRDVTAGALTRRDAALEHGVVFTPTESGGGSDLPTAAGLDFDSAATFKLRSYRLTLADVESIVDEIEEMEP